MQVSNPVAISGLAAQTQSVDPQLAAVAEEFESLLLNMMLKTMRDSVPRSDLFGDESRVRMYEEMRDEEMAKVMAARGGLGLSELIVRQFERDPTADPRAALAQTQALEAAARSYQAYGQTSLATPATLDPISRPLTPEEESR